MALAFISVAVLTVAAQWHVDGDAACRGADGSAGAPYCTIQEAFDGAELAPGDEVVIHEAATLYGDAAISAVHGEPDAPIVVRPAVGEAPILEGQLEILRSNDWTIRGLTFDGSESSRSVAILVQGDGAQIEGITIERNTIEGWGGGLASTGTNNGIITARTNDDDAGSTLRRVIVRENRIVGGRGKAIQIRGATEVVVERNTVLRGRCQRNGDANTGADPPENRLAGVTGVYLHSVSDALVTANRIQDFDLAPCREEVAAADIDDPLFRATGVFSRNGFDVEISRNFIERIGIGAQEQEGFGVNIRGGADATVHHNIVVDANGCGLCSGAQVDRGGQRPRFVANTVLGGDLYGIELDEPEAAVVVGNVIAGAAVAQLRLFSNDQSPQDPTDLSWTVENNLYDVPKGAVVGRLNFTTDHDLETWQTACDCDSDSVVADPLFSGEPEDYTAGPRSLATDLGDDVAEVSGFNGDAPDCGALEAPLVRSASILEADPDRIEVLLENRGAGGLVVDSGCAGFSVRADRADVPLVECSAPGDELLILRLERAAFEMESIQLDYAGRSLRDESAIAGTIDARAHAFNIEVANASAEPRPEGTSTGASEDDSGDGTTTDSEETSDSDPPGTSGTAVTTGVPETGTDGGGAGAFPSADGCTCTTHPRGGAWAWWLFAVLVPRRRRR